MMSWLKKKVFQIYSLTFECFVELFTYDVVVLQQNMTCKHCKHTTVFHYLCLFQSLHPEIHGELRGLFLTHFDTKVSQALLIQNTHTITHTLGYVIHLF